MRGDPAVRDQEAIGWHRSGGVWAVSVDVARPMRVEFLLDDLKQALLRLSLTGDDLKDGAKARVARELWKARGVVFHRWRHYYAARMGDRLDARTVMVATGHRTPAMFEHYADHKLEEQLKEVGAAAAEAFAQNSRSNSCVSLGNPEPFPNGRVRHGGSGHIAHTCVKVARSYPIGL